MEDSGAVKRGYAILHLLFYIFTLGEWPVRRKEKKRGDDEGSHH